MASSVSEDDGGSGVGKKATSASWRGQRSQMCDLVLCHQPSERTFCQPKPTQPSRARVSTPQTAHPPGARQKINTQRIELFH